MRIAAYLRGVLPQPAGVVGIERRGDRDRLSGIGWSVVLPVAAAAQPPHHEGLVVVVVMGVYLGRSAYLARLPLD